MRVRSIELIRYGGFSGTRVNLPESSPDIHIVVGPNESGKSTALRALEDFLFGIPVRTPMGFLHGYADMLIGARVEANGSDLYCRRRKGSKNTLLSADNQPLSGGERALVPFLTGMSREAFQLFCSLDHSRLRKGGREILEAKGDLGQALFAAGSGLQALGRIRSRLAKKAEAIWSKRRSLKREYYRAWDRLSAARVSCRDNSVSALEWNRRKKEYDRCNEAVLEARQALQAADAKLRKVSRIRRVARQVREKSRLEDEFDGLSGVADFPLGATEALDAAEQEYRIASQRAKDQRVEMKRVVRERAELNWDETVLLRRRDIERLHRRLSVIRKGREDLPKREAELAEAESRLLESAAELGWEGQTAEDVARRIPSRVAVADARSVQSELTKASGRVTVAKRTLGDAESELRRAERDLQGVTVPPDFGELASLVVAAREEFGKLDSQIHRCRSAALEERAHASALARRLRPEVDSPVSASRMAVPTQREVRSIHEARSALDRDLKECRKKLRRTEAEIARSEAGCERIEKNEKPVSRARVIELRAKRDLGWNLVRRTYVDGESVPDAEVLAFDSSPTCLANAYEDSVKAADRAADHNVRTAKAVANLREFERALEEARLEKRAACRELQDLEAQSRKLDAEWESLWRLVPFDPRKPLSMLSWLETYTELQRHVARRESQLVQLADLQRRETAIAATIVDALTAAGIDPKGMVGKGLRYLLDSVADLQRQHAIVKEKRVQLLQHQRRAVARQDSRRRQLVSAQAALKEWNSRWQTVLTDLGIRSGPTVASAEPQFDLIDTMRHVRAQIENLTNKRIAMIRRDIEEFQADVASLVSDIDRVPLESSVDEAVLHLAHRLGAALQAIENAQEKDRRIESIESTIRLHDREARSAREKIDALHALSGTDSDEELRAEIGRAERRREIRAEVDRLSQVLLQDGDGWTVKDLEAECESIDLDLAASQQTTLEQEIRQLRERLAETQAELRDAAASFSAVGGGDAGAVAESVRQNAIAEVCEIAERYVRYRSTELLLHWAIDRHRREKQAPMLRRAGVFFSHLTCKSFEGLQLRYDSRDRPQLEGRRPSGERVPVEGMSEGTLDQLYLSLRVAALEDYLDRGPSLPFVADDLFVNFDNARSEAGLQVLGQLARRCQVIVFTHHVHLVEIAKRALKGKAQVWRMDSPSSAPSEATSGRRPLDFDTRRPSVGT